jgi:hypothetical protein
MERALGVGLSAIGLLRPSRVDSQRGRSRIAGQANRPRTTAESRPRTQRTPAPSSPIMLLSAGWREGGNIDSPHAGTVPRRWRCGPWAPWALSSNRTVSQSLALAFFSRQHLAHGGFAAKFVQLEDKTGFFLFRHKTLLFGVYGTCAACAGRPSPPLAGLKSSPCTFNHRTNGARPDRQNSRFFYHRGKNCRYAKNQATFRVESFRIRRTVVREALLRPFSSCGTAGLWIADRRR